MRYWEGCSTLALEKILDADPKFEEEHYRINYPDFAMQQLMFRDEELAYIRQKQTLKVATIHGMGIHFSVWTMHRSFIMVSFPICLKKSAR